MLSLPSFYSAEAKLRIPKKNQLLVLRGLIDWQAIERLLRKIPRGEAGRDPYPPLAMFRAVLLGQWHSLSDEGLEEALCVRLDFQYFTGFTDCPSIPDSTTLGRFRNLLIRHQLLERILREINQQLEARQLKVKSAQAAVIDATVITSAARPRKQVEGIVEDRQEEVTTVTVEGDVSLSADPDARWLKKGKKSYYGYKAFARVDGLEGYVEHVEVHPAQVSETTQLDAMTEGMEKGRRVCADKAYPSEKNGAMLARKGLKDGLMRKAARNRPLRASEKKFNRMISKTRYIVEQTFGTWKRRFQYERARYVGLAKVTGQTWLKAICYNLLKGCNKAMQT